MADNQREHLRIEKKKQKNKQIKRTIWIVIALTAVILAVMKFCEFDFSSIKERFIDENGNFTLQAQDSENSFPVTLDTSSSVSMKKVNNMLIAFTSSSCNVIDPSDGQIVYSFQHGYSNPIAETGDNYIFIYDQGSGKYRLDNTAENIYESSAENSILCGAVSDNGTVVYATTSSEKQSDIYVYSKSLEKKLQFSTSYGYITSAAIDNRGRKIAFAAVNSENARLKTVVYTMNVGDFELRSEFELEDKNVIDLNYSDSGTLYVVGSDFISIVHSQKNIEDVFEAGSLNILCYTYTDKNELVVAYNEYSNASENKLAYITASGNVKTQLTFHSTPFAISATNREVSILFSDSILTYKLKSGEQKDLLYCKDNNDALIRISSKIFVHHQSAIDLCGESL